MKLIIISGRSGSGKSVALRALEDLGYYCVDNIPVNLLPTLTHTVVDEYDQVAVSIDVRNLPKNPDDLVEILDYLPSSWSMTIVYIDASDDVLVKRFSETRRLHPLAKLNKSLSEAIRAESALLAPIAERADLYLDTDKLTIHQLAELIRERILGKKSSRLVLVFESFGFKHGVPSDADYVFDVRCLPNPYWDPALRGFNGLEEPVQEFLSSHQEVEDMKNSIIGFLEPWLGKFETNNRSYMTIAIGCTGGQHRSVFLCEQIGAHFKTKYQNILIRHKELSAPVKTQ